MAGLPRFANYLRPYARRVTDRNGQWQFQSANPMLPKEDQDLLTLIENFYTRTQTIYDQNAAFAKYLRGGEAALERTDVHLLKRQIFPAIQIRDMIENGFSVDTMDARLSFVISNTVDPELSCTCGDTVSPREIARPARSFSPGAQHGVKKFALIANCSP